MAPSSTPPRFNPSLAKIIFYSLYVSPVAVAQYTPTPRWAQAAALLENTLYVHGGLSDSFNSYSYSSAPETSDLLVLDLSTSFHSSSPPWQLLSSNSSPALAWHTLSAFSITQLLLFGGQPGPNSWTHLDTLNDSSGLLSTSSESGSSFFMEPQNWANEPMRRIRHSASYANGGVWLIGGEKADGSGNAFSDHYFFSQSAQEFVQLPSSANSPPDIYGHASLVLPDGRLLVLGGYCASCSHLVPMNTVWSLNTTQHPPLWEMLSVSGESLPSPRRDFAAVVLSNSNVIIHGGGDAQLQTTYSDGWILDTSQNPMVWSSVAALAQLGQRKDHLAIQASGYVLFCFGYGASAPASTSLFIYNPMTSSTTSFYAAPSPGSAPAVTSLPLPTQTFPTPQGGAGTAGLGGPSSTPSHASGSTSSSSKRTIAIALGTTFGVLGLVAGGFAAVHYARHRRNWNRRVAGRFFPLANDTEFSSSRGSVATTTLDVVHLEDQFNESATGVGMTDILAHLGISTTRSRARKPRKDMFADEDTRSFGMAGYSSAAQREDGEGTSVWSLRSVSALVRGVIGSEPNVNQGKHEWERVSHRSDGAQEALIHPGSLRSNYSSHVACCKDPSFGSYSDPFEDPVPDDRKLHPGTPEKDADYDHSVLDEAADSEWSAALGHRDSVWRFSVRSHTLTPLREASHVSLSDPSNSLPSLQEDPQGQTANHSHADNPALSPSVSICSVPQSPTTSRSSDLPPVAPVTRYSVISDPTLARSHSTSRTDSWWSRLTKPPLLDRRASITASKPLLDFRDPTPAPPLVTSEEAGNSNLVHPSNNTLTGIAGHGKSLSSAHSGRTANTDSAEHLGARYDVVQRLASDGSSSRRASSLGSAEITEQGMLAIAHSEIPLSSGLPHVDPPRSTVIQVDPAKSLEAEAPTDPLTSLKFKPTSSRKGIMASRIKAYERRVSHESESQQISAPRNTRYHEEVASRSRPTLQYGVVPHSPLFIANPDLGHIS